MFAAHEGCTEILDYVVEQGEVLDAALLTRALNCAGAHSKLEAAQWLRQHGAQWPAVLRYEHQQLGLLWSDDMIFWARAEGCTAPTTL
jgi:hypothetical protein